MSARLKSYHFDKCTNLSTPLTVFNGRYNTEFRRDLRIKRSLQRSKVVPMWQVVMVRGNNESFYRFRKHFNSSFLRWDRITCFCPLDANFSRAFESNKVIYKRVRFYHRKKFGRMLSGFVLGGVTRCINISPATRLRLLALNKEQGRRL